MKLKLLLLLSCCLSILLITYGNNSGSPTKSAKNKKKAEVYTTTADRRLSFNHTQQCLSTKPGCETVIVLNPAVSYQEMDGFGAAVTGSSCYNLMQMSPADRRKFLIETFSDKEGLGFSYVRISIGCSDFSLTRRALKISPCKRKKKNISFPY